MGRPPPALLFDLDGTVVDSAPGIVSTLLHTLRFSGVTPPTAEELAADIGPHPSEILARHGVRHAGLSRGVAEYRRRYLTHGLTDSAVYAGITELLAELSATDALRATATAKLVPVARRMLAVHGLEDSFHTVGGAAEPHRLTKADIISWTLDELGARADTTVVMIGDRHYDIAGGRAHGALTIGVTWGYGTRSVLEAAGADRIASRPEELLAYLAPILGQ